MTIMIESFKNYKIEDYKLVDNCYHLKFKDGPELMCTIEGQVSSVEGERHLNDAVLKSTYISPNGRRVGPSGVVIDMKSLNIHTNKGVCSLKYERIKPQPVEGVTEMSDIVWVIN
jgi:hypothetical protein